MKFVSGREGGGVLHVHRGRKTSGYGIYSQEKGGDGGSPSENC